MQYILKASILATALTFSAGSFVVAHSQQLQSDGTMSQPQQTAPAQSGMARHGRNPAHEAKHLSKQLGLTPDQTSQLQPILAERNARMAALRADTTLDPRSMHRQGRAIATDTQGRINALLTPAQQQLYADMRAAHRHAQDAPAPAPTA